MKKRILITLTVLLVLSMFPATRALAGSTGFSGTLDASDPTMPVVFISTPTCTGQGVTPVHYEVEPFYVDAAGVYNFTLASAANFASLYIYVDSFNPASPLTNCIAGSNSGSPTSLSVALDPSKQYFVVPFDDTFAQAGGDYTLTISGTGNPFLGIRGGGCGLKVPEGSVVGEAPLGAYIYSVPGQTTDKVLNPGTYIVVGQDASQTYYKIVLACNFVWVRKDTMQPSYLPPQNGTPLPTRVVS